MQTDRQAGAQPPLSRLPVLERCETFDPLIVLFRVLQSLQSFFSIRYLSDLEMYL